MLPGELAGGIEQADPGAELTRELGDGRPEPIGPERGEGDVFERLHLDHEAALQNNMMEQARVAEETAHRQAFRARPAREHGAARLHAWGDTEEGRTK